MSIDASEAIEVFISYAHKDKKWRNELEKHLSVLKLQGLITTWHDEQLNPGEDWQTEIDKHLNIASIILPLVSPDYLASNFTYGIEMRRALERHFTGEARVIPILLRYADWQNTPFNKLQFLPTNGKPIISWRDRDKAF